VENDGPVSPRRFDPPHAESIPLQPPADFLGAEFDVQLVAFKFRHRIALRVGGADLPSRCGENASTESNSDNVIHFGNLPPFAFITATAARAG
jgi:hypothetical protein